MTPKHAKPADERTEAAMLLAKRIGSNKDTVPFSAALLDILVDSVQNSRHICFTGLGQYEDQSD